MEFRLFYQGPLKSNGDALAKHKIRKYFHPQLKKLWEQQPLIEHKSYIEVNPENKELSIIKQVEDFKFAPLVTSNLGLIANLHITLLSGEPGLIVQGGDIDNRLKTLFDALRYPANKQEIPNNEDVSDEFMPFFCLLEDDKLITSVSVETDRLLIPLQSQSDVILMIYVKIKATKLMWANMSIIA